MFFKNFPGLTTTDPLCCWDQNSGPSHQNPDCAPVSNSNILQGPELPDRFRHPRSRLQNDQFPPAPLLHLTRNDPQGKTFPGNSTRRPCRPGESNHIRERQECCRNTRPRTSNRFLLAACRGVYQVDVDTRRRNIWRLFSHHYHHHYQLNTTYAYCTDGSGSNADRSVGRSVWRSVDRSVDRSVGRFDRR